MRKFQPRSLAFLLALGVAGVLGLQTAQADVYRWTDAQGRVQYSDRPMPGAERIRTTARMPGSAEAAAAAEREKTKATQAQAQTQTQREKTAATQQTVAQDVAGARAEQCKAAREHYDKAIKARRMFRNSPSGEREYLSDADANAARAEAKTALDQACS